MQLTDPQLQHYKTFGFLVIPGYLNDQTVQTLRDTLDRMKTEESGESDTLKHKGRVIGMFHQDPLHLSLLDDPNLFAIASQLLTNEKPLRFFGDEYASFSTPADWHPDIRINMPAESLKFAFYLDDLSRGGFLRVVPGSQNPGYYEAVAALRASEKPAPEIECAYDCMTQPGDLLIFNLKIWHQGTANPEGTHRRVIFWSIGQDHPEFNEVARNYHSNLGRGTGDEPWPAVFLENAPLHRQEMLGVFDEGTPKQKALAALPTTK